MATELAPELVEQIERLQQNEITEHEVYRRLAQRVGGPNGEVLDRIAQDELSHYEQWARYTGRRPRPVRWRVWLYLLTARLFGFTFAVKLMEKGEERAQQGYEQILEALPETAAIIEDENRHERMLLAMLDEERLRYVGSMVLGLSDALVELAGALAGLTFALQNTRLVALAALVTGLAASLSMAASEYLSKKSERPEGAATADAAGQHPVKAAAYTGAAYVVTVLVLVAPYFLLGNAYGALAMSLSFSVAIVCCFTAFLAIVQDRPFGRTFLEMAGLTLGVAGISFLIGTTARAVIGVDH